MDEEELYASEYGSEYESEIEEELDEEIPDYQESREAEIKPVHQDEELEVNHITPFEDGHFNLSENDAIAMSDK